MSWAVISTYSDGDDVCEGTFRTEAMAMWAADHVRRFRDDQDEMPQVRVVASDTTRSPTPEEGRDMLKHDEIPARCWVMDTAEEAYVEGAEGRTTVERTDTDEVAAHFINAGEDQALTSIYVSRAGARKLAYLLLAEAEDVDALAS